MLENNCGMEHLLHYLDDFWTAGPANSRSGKSLILENQWTPTMQLFTNG